MSETENHLTPIAGAQSVADQGVPALSREQRRVWTCFWSAILVCTVPMLWIYFTRMWRLPHYQYFPFAIAAVGYLAWRRSDHVLHPPSGVIAIASLVLGGLAAGFGWGFGSPWLVAIAFVCFALSCLSSMRGKHGRSLALLALPLALLVRLPLGYDQMLVVELQHLTTVLSSLTLDVLSIPHAVDRNVLNLPGRELFVAEACSGIQSVFTMLFASTLIIVIKWRRLWLAPAYLLIAIFLAVAGNVLRVTIVAVVDHWFGLDWASGWAHDALGYATLGLALLMLFSFDRLIIAVLHPTNRIDESAKHNPIVRLWNWCVDDGSFVDSSEEYFLAGSGAGPQTQRSASRFERMLWTLPSTPFSILFVILAVVLTGMSFQRAWSVKPVGFDQVQEMYANGLIWEPSSNLFDLFSNDFKLTSHQVVREGEDPVLGNNADVWAYSRPLNNNRNINGQFVISQTYNEWHELCICYQNRGWNLLKRSPRGQRGKPLKADAGEDSNPDLSYIEALFSNPSGQRGYLWFTGIAASGRTIQAPVRLGRLEGRFSDLLDVTPDNDEPIMMVQLWIAADQKLDKTFASKIDEDYSKVVERIVDGLGKGSNLGGQAKP